MSTRLTVPGIGLVCLLLSLNTGCYYDQLLQEQNANRILQEDLARTKEDLHDSESMNQVLQAKVDSLNGQLTAKQQLVDSLTAENESLRDKWAKAMGAVEEMAKKDLAPPVVVNTVLPPQLDTALKDFAQKYPDLLEYLPEKGVVRWKADLLFDLGSDVLKSDVAEPLQAFSEICRSPAADGFDVIIVGHTDNTPIRKAATLAEHKTNWHLSAHRAISVMEALRSDGVPEPRMGVMGYGEFRPIAPNTTAANKALNRRVEIFLWPTQKADTTSAAELSSGTPVATPEP